MNQGMTPVLVKSTAGAFCLDNRGVLSLPLSMMLVTTAFAGFGTLGVMRHWRKLTETQLRLDRCVGQTALDLRDSLERIEASNTQIRILRAAQAAADLVEAPGSLVPLIEAEAMHQDLEVLHWRVRQGAWMLERGCDGQSDLPMALPTMSWDRLPPDTDGPQALSWSGGQMRLTLQLTHLPRAAAAVVEAQESDSIAGEIVRENTWNASWAVPAALGSQFIRTNSN